MTTRDAPRVDESGDGLPEMHRSGEPALVLVLSLAQGEAFAILLRDLLITIV